MKVRKLYGSFWQSRFPPASPRHSSIWNTTRFPAVCFLVHDARKRLIPTVRPAGEMIVLWSWLPARLAAFYLIRKAPRHEFAHFFGIFHHAKGRFILRQAAPPPECCTTRIALSLSDWLCLSFKYGSLPIAQWYSSVAPGPIHFTVCPLLIESGSPHTLQAHTIF